MATHRSEKRAIVKTSLEKWLISCYFMESVLIQICPPGGRLWREDRDVSGDYDLI